MIRAMPKVKPWAVLLVPITLVPASVPGRIGERLRGPITSIAVAAALWSPFVVSDPSTLSNLKPTVWLAPDSVLRLLADRGINEVQLEAGATLAGAFLDAGLVDEVLVRRPDESIQAG